jgi:hypothetical protein
MYVERGRPSKTVVNDAMNVCHLQLQIRLGRATEAEMHGRELVGTQTAQMNAASTSYSRSY